MTTKPVYVLDRRRNLVECDIIVYESDTGVFTLADGTVVAAEVAANSITEAQIKAGALTTASLNPAAGITSGQLAGGITNAQLAGSIAASKLAGGILPTQLAAGVAKSLSGTVLAADTTETVITIPAKSLVTDVIAVCTTPFSGTNTPAFAVTLGDTNTAAGFLPTISMANGGLSAGVVSGETLSARGSLLWTNGAVTGGSEGAGPTFTVVFPTLTTQPTPIKKYYDSADIVKATITKSGTVSAGVLTVYMAYIALA